MTDRKHILLAVVIFTCVASLGCFALAWPNYRQVMAVDREIADLKGRIETLDERALEVARLAERMHAAQRQVQEELRIIPESPDLAELIRALSMPVDGGSVSDQTFTAGTSTALLTGDEMESLSRRVRESAGGEPAACCNSPMGMALTIDMVATFDSVIALLRATESIDRLMRISTLRLQCERDEKNSERRQPLLAATVGLEAVYSPQ